VDPASQAEQVLRLGDVHDDETVAGHRRDAAEIDQRADVELHAPRPAADDEDVSRRP